MTWIAIAERPRAAAAGQTLTWKRVEGSPYSIKEAQHLYDEGLAEIVHRHEPDRAVMLLKIRAVQEKRRVRLFVREGS